MRPHLKDSWETGSGDVRYSCYLKVERYLMTIPMKCCFMVFFVISTLLIASLFARDELRKVSTKE